MNLIVTLPVGWRVWPVPALTYSITHTLKKTMNADLLHQVVSFINDRRVREQLGYTVDTCVALRIPPAQVVIPSALLNLYTQVYTKVYYPQERVFVALDWGSAATLVAAYRGRKANMMVCNGVDAFSGGRRGQVMQQDAHAETRYYMWVAGESALLLSEARKIGCGMFWEEEVDEVIVRE